MGNTVCVLLVLLLASIPGLAQTVEHLYSPDDNLERSELAQLDTATRTIDIAMYSFTDRYLAEELAALARKGVRIRVYRDREQFAQETQWGVATTTSILLAAGVEIRVKGARDLMHLKSYAIDGRLLRTGSANWSPTGQAPGQRCRLRVVARSRRAVRTKIRRNVGQSVEYGPRWIRTLAC